MFFSILLLLYGYDQNSPLVHSRSAHNRLTSFRYSFSQSLLFQGRHTFLRFLHQSQTQFVLLRKYFLVPMISHNLVSEWIIFQYHLLSLNLQYDNLPVSSAEYQRISHPIDWEDEKYITLKFLAIHPSCLQLLRSRLPIDQLSLSPLYNRLLRPSHDNYLIAV